jgi:hypothetical protein
MCSYVFSDADVTSKFWCLASKRVTMPNAMASTIYAGLPPTECERKAAQMLPSPCSVAFLATGLQIQT